MPGEAFFFLRVALAW
jgi:hypothetical protein